MSNHITFLPRAETRTSLPARADLAAFVRERLQERFPEDEYEVQVDRFPEEYQIIVYSPLSEGETPDEVFDFCWEIEAELRDKGYEVLVYTRPVSEKEWLQATSP
jgi:hypothetical protein